MRWTGLALVSCLAVGLISPALAQTALPGQPGVARPVPPPKPATGLTALPGATATATAKPAPAGALVNINTATEQQLDAVPQIGEKRAASIIKNRPYRKLDDLVTKKALPAGIFEKIKSYLTV